MSKMSRGRPDLPQWLFEAPQITALAARRPADVAAAVAAVLSLITRGPSNSINAVLILCGLGEIDRAFEVSTAYLLERGPLMASVRCRDGQVSINDQHRRKTNMLFVPVAREMPGDKRRRELTAQIGLPNYWKRSGKWPDILGASA